MNNPTDNIIRIRYLTAHGFSLDEARRYVLERPKPQTLGERMAIVNARLRELGKEILKALRLK